MENVEIAKNLMSTFQQFRHVMKNPKNIEGLKQNEMGLLFHIRFDCSEGSEGATISELSSTLHVTSPSITQLVTSLEEQGLVIRKMDKDDRRSVKVSLTAKGNEITQKAEEQATSILTGLVEHLGAEKSVELTKILDEVLLYFAKVIKVSKNN
jgi:DNA-binding MarR family transcriptional regulator